MRVEPQGAEASAAASRRERRKEKQEVRGESSDLGVKPEGYSVKRPKEESVSTSRMGISSERINE